MSEYLFLVFIAPIEYLLRSVLEWAATVTGSYGLGIILMSLVINVLLIPVYHLADTWQDAERSVQKRIAGKLAKIKRVFSGKERYMVTQTLYRQNGYHPILAVRASFGLLIQIPFFFAAYHLLNTYAPMQGISFAGIADIGKPDALLSIGGLHINILPIVMTILSIASAWVYTYRLAKRDKIQLYTIAGLFLVLLYNAPAGMVLYWTCNNIFFLLKNMLYEKLQVFGTANNKQFLTSVYKLLNAFEDKARTLYLASLDWTTKNTLTWKTLVHPKSLFITLFACIGRTFIFISDKINKLSLPPKALSQLFFLSIILLAALIYVFVPIKVYFSDTTVFSEPLSAIAAELTLKFAFLIGLFACIFWLLRGAMRTLYALYIIYLTISAIAYTFIFIRDYGVIDAFILQYEDRIFAPYYILVDIGIGALLLFTFIFCIRKNKLSIITFAMSIFLVITVVSSFSHFKLSKELATKNYEFNQEGTVVTFPEYINKMFSFSREGHNIVVVMLDMFTGDHLGQILEEHPTWRMELDGFVWYPDTMTEAHASMMSQPSMLGGPAATPYQINATASKISLEAIVSKHTAALPTLLAKHNFHSSIASPELVVEDELLKYIPRENLLWQPPLDYGIGRKFAPMYFNNTVYHGRWVSDFLGVLGGFQILPWSFRGELYDDGWWNGSRPRNTGDLSAMSYTILAMLPNMSNTDSPTNTFKFITNFLPHLPWTIHRETLQPMLGDPYPETKGELIKVDGIIPEHYYAEAASIKLLLRWFQWMKDNGVYDNTQIIILSDHGEADSVSLAKAFGADISGHTPFGIGSTYPGRPHGLLLVKNANARGLLQESPQLMTTSDLTALIYKDIAPRLGLPDSDEWSRRWEEGASRVRYHAVGSWTRSRHEKNRFNIDELWKVTGTMFDKDNWEEVAPPLK